MTPTNDRLEKAVKLGFSASNNEAEYEAVLNGLRAARELKLYKIFVFSDSQLMVNQNNGDFQARDERMARYLALIQEELALTERNYTMRRTAGLYRLSPEQRIGMPTHSLILLQCWGNPKPEQSRSSSNPSQA